MLNSHVYVSSNEVNNHVIHFARRSDGSLVEVEKIATGGAGTGEFKPLSGQASAPDTLASAGAITMSRDWRQLFIVNAGDNSVSSFSVADDGKLTQIDRQPTGESGRPSSLSYDDHSNTLYVLHTFGPNHIRSFKVDAGKLVNTGISTTVNTGQLQRRVPVQITVSPDGRFVLVNVLYNDFSPPGTTPKVRVSANEDNTNGLMVFPIADDGTLGTPVINDAGGAEPFALVFLNGSSDTFVNTLAKSDGVVLGKLHADGTVNVSKLASATLDTTEAPADVCWISLSPDNKFAYATNFVRGDLTSYRIDGDSIAGARDGLGKVEGDGTFIADGKVSSGPVDSWASKDGYLYQMYPNASKLVAYRMNGEELEAVDSVSIPYNGSIGITGY
ncbi:hypothetical protein ABB29_07540 [Pseudoxanthomonas dokdonensis]|uniref:3-carboxymuconate cyclase n=1 Tax=Pseudoxanthomonas dokdonensis TaxID=344882 RepID=A0A0R0CV20_9GAMM|nr:hypothetical protein ABB29_07540 [Pseudoxanthomonas dokdonensis]